MGDAGAQDFGLPGRDMSVNRGLWASTALATCLALYPAYVRADGCAFNGNTYTCSGSDIPDVNFTNLEDGDYLYENVTGNFGPTSSNSNNYALIAEGEANDGEGYVDNGHGKDVSGAAGYDGFDMNVTMHFDLGYGIESVKGGIYITTTAGAGVDGIEDSDGGTAYGGVGGDGGAGGAITIVFSDDSGGQTPHSIKTGDRPAVMAVSTGGAAGNGGKGTNNDGFHQGNGGFGGTGGAGGDVSVTIEDDHYVDVTSSVHGGIVLISTGANGGDAGEGLSDNVATGGNGGQGGDGGDVTLTASSTTNTITTSGEAIHGIIAISEAGDGGDGGVGNGPDKGVGGNGGAGGTGGSVSVTYAGDITTSGEMAQGILIQSIGGAGGNGGVAESWFDGNGGYSSIPGPGGTATLDYSNGTITTTGSEASAIIVESVGGFAGASGGSSGFVAFGASGASGGDGNTVTVDLDTVTLNTSGDYASGLLAFSIGGGGGVGSSDDGFDAIGAAGGAGGTGGEVDVTLSGTNSIITQGQDAPGIMMLSVGGGGGTSGGNDGVVALGGQGGQGGDGGTASLTSDGDTTVSTQGDYSVGVMVMSIGNGGGTSTSPTAAWALGANGGGGGTGGDATVDFKSGTLKVTTNGDVADGILITSIGGGGGHGGSSLAAIDLIEPVSGSSGGSGGAGGDVTVTTESGSIDVETSGFKSNGFVAQSVGGGGGTGGTVVNVDIGLTFNQQAGATSTATGQDGGTVSVGDKDTVGLAGSVTTHGDSSSGILIQSVGGGGGSMGNNIEAGVSIEFNHDMGADGGAGGDGGTVTVNTTASVTTEGDHSDGILVQSIGGGGGQSTNVVDANVGVNMSQFVGNQGSSGGSGGDGGDVTLYADSVIITSGDNALGILAQSVGAGGGKAGYTVDGDVSIELASVTLGSSGGLGGDAGDVSVTSSGSITTTGDVSIGILAQSVAGGGGQVGTTVSGAAGITLAYTHGGDGGAGGNAGNVAVTNAATISTTGQSADGIQAMSVGGGGGSGTVTVSGSVSFTGDVSVTHGGDGGTGGTAGTVTLANTGSVTTTGDYSYGLSAQSIGGAGGKGGLTVSGAASGGLIAGTVDVAVGGDGGSGGTASDVTVTNSGAITTGTLDSDGNSTGGYSAVGIFAQSIGGNGGDGGAVIAGAIEVSSDGGATVSVGVGGDGGGSGQTGTVTVTNNEGGDIITYGHLADGIFAQSVGGNGGKGGGSYALSLSLTSGASLGAKVEVGGSGGGGAVGNTVTVENHASISTSGGNANGIYAQSIGGNGGKGAYGFALAGDLDWKPESDAAQANVDVTVGGSGGTGADAGAVSVTNTGKITTASDTSYGIYAQSVGGGGGDGGQAGSHSYGYTKKQTDTTSTTASYSLNFTMGGSDGASGDGDTVTVDNSGDISTAGNASYAIYAQSVGGGGGNSGNGSSGLTGWVADVANVAEMLDDIYDTYKEVANFPKGLLSITIDIGGKAGASGTGGEVTVTNSGTLHTTGDNGTAIYAQSIGGGGGNGGDGSQGLLEGLTIAQSGSGGGDGGDISIDGTGGTIITEGDGAMGIYAQSVGGGGGSGGDIEGNIVTGISNFWETASAELFGSDNGGNGGDGGSVYIESTGDITTSGENAHGVWAQSVGGGGGAAGMLDTQAISGSDQNAIGSTGDAGDGGWVDVVVADTITVTGEGAHGVFAQSASGGDGYSGGVKIKVTGTISAQGANARAILAQSTEDGTDDPQGENLTSDGDECTEAYCRGTSHIYIETGAVVETTSSSAYETIGVSGGRSTYNSDGSIYYSNLIENHGTIQSANAEAVVIANDDLGALRIHNLDGALISGSLQLSDSNRTEFVNESGATFAAGSTVYLGALGNYTGDSGGTISAYGEGTIGTSTVSFGGAYSEAGTIYVDAALASDGTITNDLLALVTLSDTASISLTGEVQPVWSGESNFASGDTGTLTVATGADNSSNAVSLNVDSMTAVDTSTVTYDLSTSSDGSELYAAYTVDYSGETSGVELGANARKYAAYFSNAMKSVQAGTAGDATEALTQMATDYLNASTGAELETLYRYQTPEEHLIGATKAVSSLRSLNQLLQSCPTLDPTAGLDFLHQNECTWVQGIGTRHHQDETDESPEYNETTWGLAIGSQHEVGEDLFLEIGGQIEAVSIDGENFDQDGNRYSFGAALKKEIGRYTLSTTISGGFYGFDYDRGYTVNNVGYQANSDIDGRYLGAELRASAVYLGQGGFYAKPSAALAFTQVWQDGFTETGSGPQNWNVASTDESWLTFTPMIELGRAFTVQNRASLAFVRAGVTMNLNDPTLTMTSSLVGADASVADLSSSLSTDRYQGDLTAGIEIMLRENLSMSLLGRGAISENSYDYGGTARIELRF